MLGLKGPMTDCPVDEQCLEWAHKYLKDCVCDFRDEISLALGLLSVFSWGVAEVPQIITNFKEKNTEGVSLAFLMTWVLGDMFNLAGCFLEPATLPTQFYMAVLYTITTFVLVGQTVYYDYLRVYLHPELKYERVEDEIVEDEIVKPGKGDVEAQKSRPIETGGSTSPDAAGTPTTTINVPRSRRSSRGELFYMSARSLASSHTPTVGSYLVGSRESSGHTQGFLRPSHGSGAAPDLSSHSNSPGPGALARTAAASILLVGSVGLSSNILSGGSTGFTKAGGQVLRTGRNLLQASISQAGFFPVFPKRSYFGETESTGALGEIFGWLMAAIYMGGRLPQILLNIKRGTVEGLNPLMFVFALVGNATYVGSILVRTLDWVMIKPNMPWLVDAGVCVCLDTFIICQVVYYATRAKVGSPSSKEEEEKNGSYEAIR